MTTDTHDEFVFWKQAQSCNAWPWDIYEALVRGDVPSGVLVLPCSDITGHLRELFPNCSGKGNLLCWKAKNEGSFKVHVGDHHFSVTMTGVSNSDKNQLLDIFEQFECPPYDARLAERYGLQGMANRDLSSDYVHARFDYLRGVGRISGEEVYEPSWEDSIYVWDRDLWDEVYASHLATHPENQSPGEMELIVTDRQSIEEGIIVRSAYVVISICDPGSPMPKVRQSAGFRGVLHLQFHDAEPTSDGSPPRDARLMSRRQAVDIWQFVQSHRSEVGAIVCHCEQGASRSPAVAAALAIEFNCDLSEVVGHRQPNRYVFDLMRSAIESDWTNPG